MTEQCNRCRFWREDMRDRDPNDADFGFGHCRRLPPVVSEWLTKACYPTPAYGTQCDPEILTATMSSCSLWPATHATDWCGQFQTKNPAPAIC